jgi:hypothetical protein
VKLLILGWRHNASMTIRGEQLGAALGARVTTDPTPADWDWLSVHHRAGTPAAIILIKHASRYALQAQRWNLPIVWDALDFWSQPRDNQLAEPQARALLAGTLEAVRPQLFIGATPAMAEAGGGVFVPHHAWPGLVPTPARAEVAVVAYQGSPRYLGQWAAVLQHACARRGWRFVINPPDLGAADLVVAFRDGPWDGWICRQWKSGIKAVNALAAGRPLLAQASEGAKEGIGTTVETPAELAAALDWWRDLTARQAVVTIARERARARTLEAVAAQYRAVLERAWQVAA